jgi:hypothetical protein
METPDLAHAAVVVPASEVVVVNVAAASEFSSFQFRARELSEN